VTGPSDGRGGLGYNEKSFVANIEVITSEEEELCLILVYCNL
jgi:hypothetical protein